MQLTSVHWITERKVESESEREIAMKIAANNHFEVKTNDIRDKSD